MTSVAHSSQPKHNPLRARSRNPFRFSLHHYFHFMNLHVQKETVQTGGHALHTHSPASAKEVLMMSCPRRCQYISFLHISKDERAFHLQEVPIVVIFISWASTQVENKMRSAAAEILCGAPARKNIPLSNAVRLSHSAALAPACFARSP